jgi:hypothetical protein
LIHRDPGGHHRLPVEISHLGDVGHLSDPEW